MAKEKLLIWGGHREQLSLKNLNTHASVSAYFLTKRLSQYYNIVNVTNMHHPEELLSHIDAKVMLSTFQKGFTSRIVEKGKLDLFMEIRENFKGKICSIVDGISKKMKYYEDILFTVLPPPILPVRKVVARRCFNRNIKITRMGWCAEPSECYPLPVPHDQINIFVDHPVYSSGSPDCTLDYYCAFRDISQKYPKLKLNIFHQNNQGVTKWDLNSRIGEINYVRQNRVPWKDIIKYYQTTHIFCVTHSESAGLAVIEAAMCGARIYIPAPLRIQPGQFFGPFIRKKLMSDGISFTTLKYNYFGGDLSNRIVKAFENDMRNGFDRDRIHQRLDKTNSWEIAARRISRTLA